MKLKYNKQLENILLHENHYRKCNKINMMDLKERNNKRFSKVKFNVLHMDFSNFYSSIKLNKIKI